MSTKTVNSFFSDISKPNGFKSDVITQALAEAVLAKLGENNTLADVEKMILDDHQAEEVSQIRVHSRRAMKWRPKTGEEMRTLFEHRDKDEDNYVDLCPQKNLGVWMKLKMRKEFEDFKQI